MPRKLRDVPWLDIRDGVYTVFWYDPNKGAVNPRTGRPKGRTERFSLRTRDPAEAAHRYAAFLTQGKDIYAGPRTVRLTCGEAFDFYIENHVKPKVVDKTRAEDAIRNLRLYWRDVDALDVDIPKSREYAQKRMTGTISLKTKRRGLAREASPATVNRELTTLVAAINHCAEWKHKITKAEAINIAVEKCKTKRSKGIWLFADELTAFRNACDPKTRDFTDVAYYTAARKASVETLSVFQVNLDTRKIDLAKPDDPETNKRKPIVHIAPELYPVIKRLVEESTDGTLFGIGYKSWSGWKTARKKAGLRTLPAKDMRVGGSLSPHVLRHSRATHLLQQGKHPKAVADLLGDDVATVLKVYGHACPDFTADLLGETKNEQG